MATESERMPSSSAGGSEKFFGSCVALGCGRPCGWAGCCEAGTAASGHGSAAGSPSGGSVPGGWPTPETGAAGGLGQRGRGRAGPLWGGGRNLAAGSCAGEEGARWRTGACVSLGRGWRGAWGSERAGAWPPGTETPAVWGEEGSPRAGASAARGRGCSAAGWRGSSGGATGSACVEERETCAWEGERVTCAVWGEKGSGDVALLVRESAFSWARRLCVVVWGRTVRESVACGCLRSWPEVHEPVAAGSLHPRRKRRTLNLLKTTADSACDTDVAAAQNRPWPPSHLYPPQIQRDRSAWPWGLGTGTCFSQLAFVLHQGRLNCHDPSWHGGRRNACSCPGSPHRRVLGRGGLASARG